jgi:threonine aldolase
MSAIPPFRSDNTAGACPEVLTAITKANRGLASSYGSDDLSGALDRTMSEIFERRCWCFPVGTGTAANALALSTIAPARTLIACHAQAHILRNEDVAVQLFSPGIALEPLSGMAGRIAVDALEDFTRRFDASARRWSALSLTQLTEAGTHYGLDEIATLAGIAHRRGGRVHMDGARFANAVVGLGCSPAEMSWRSGIDVLSLGATKNGTLNADAVVAFDAATADAIRSHLKRSGQLFSKMRFMAAQLLAMFEADLWLKNARHANAMARRLSDALVALTGIDVVCPVEGNHVFLRLAEQLERRLSQSGSLPWRSGTDEVGRPVYRLVTSFQTKAEEIERFAALLV